VIEHWEYYVVEGTPRRLASFEAMSFSARARFAGGQLGWIELLEVAY
jgi:hypothetical protein